MISIAHKLDFHQIEKIWQKGVLNNHPNIGEINILSDYLYTNFSNRKYPFEFWVAKKNNIILGWVSISPIFTQPLKKLTHAEISIYVNQDYKENGIGTKITKFVLNELIQTNICTVWAYVLNENTNSKKMCENAGMKICGKTKDKNILIKEY